jgi:flagellar hook protein FlgE
MLKTSDTTGNLNITYNGTGTNKPDAQNVTIDFTELTQYAGSTTVRSAGNGNVAGTLNGIQIDSSGIITGIYTNGIRRPEAQVAVAHFANLPGLLKTGQNLYKESDNSGVPVINDAEKFGVTITAGALEMYNVDLSNEFAEMIITQRGFQSNSKIITVGDEMIETAINMKR